MKKNRLSTLVVLAACTFGLWTAVGCGKNEAPPVEVRDGPELAALVETARKAIIDGDAGTFYGLYLEHQAVRAREDWEKFQRMKWDDGEYLVARITECPVLERKETGLHIQKLEMHVWHDLSRDSGDRQDVYYTLWSFERAESQQWRLVLITIDKRTRGYGTLMYGLHRLSYREYLALGMKWAEGADPTPVLDGAWAAVASEDVEEMKPYFVDGVLFHALEANVDLPGTPNGKYGPGENNRALSRDQLNQTIKNMRESTQILEMDPLALTPYFCAYRVTSMPDDCTKLELFMEYDGAYAPSKKVTRFSLKWAGVYMKSRWLVDRIGTQYIHFH